MAVNAESFQVGQALVVYGTVRVESANGVSRIIEPNSQIFFEDRIDTGNNGAVSIMLNDSDGTQIDVGRLSEILIDEDVLNVTLPDLGDVSVEAGLLADLLHSQDSFDSVASMDSVLPAADDSAAEETGAADSIPGLDTAEPSVSSSDSSDDGLGSIDDELDMTNLIPPPEDGA